MRPDQLSKPGAAAASGGGAGSASAGPKGGGGGGGGAPVDAKKAGREAERLQNEKLAREKKMRAEQQEVGKIQVALEAKLGEKRAVSEAIDGAQDELAAARAALSAAQERGVTLNRQLAGGAGGGGKRGRQVQLTLPQEGLEPSSVMELARLVGKARVAVEQADDDKQKALRLCVKILGKGHIVDALDGGAGLRSLLAGR